MSVLQRNRRHIWNTQHSSSEPTIESKIKDSPGNLPEKGGQTPFNMNRYPDCAEATPYLIKLYRKSLLDELASLTAQNVLRNRMKKQRNSSNANKISESSILKTLKSWMCKLPENYLLSVDPEDALLHISLLKYVRLKKRTKIHVQKVVLMPSKEKHHNPYPFSGYKLNVTISSLKDITHVIYTAMVNIGVKVVQMQNAMSNDGIYVCSFTTSAPNLKEEITDLQIEHYLEGCIAKWGMDDRHCEANPSVSLQNLINMSKYCTSGSQKSPDFECPTKLPSFATQKHWKSDPMLQSDSNLFMSYTSSNSSLTIIGDYDNDNEALRTHPNRIPSPLAHFSTESEGSAVGFLDPDYFSGTTATNLDDISIDDVSGTSLENENIHEFAEALLCGCSAEQSYPIVTCKEHKDQKFENIIYPLLRGYEFSIDAEEVHINSRVWKGWFSSTFSANYRGEVVAVKVINSLVTGYADGSEERRKRQADIIFRSFTREVKALKELEHPNIYEFQGTCLINSQPCLVFEYINTGRFCNYFRSGGKGHKLPLYKLLTLMVQVADAMKFIHSKGFIHRDLKSSNILFDEESWVCKVSDMGVCCPTCEATSGETGTYRWMAPEVIMHQRYGTPVDVYSYGVVLWEVVVKELPFNDMSPIQAAFAVAKHGMRPKLPDDTPERLRCLINKCWCDDPQSRATFELVCNLLPGVVEHLKENKR